MTPAIRLNLFTVLIATGSVVIARSPMSSMEFAAYVLCVLMTLGWFVFIVITGPGERR